MYELVTDAGTVFSVSENLASAMADVLAGVHRSSESDLVEAVNVPLAEVIAFPGVAAAS